MLQVKQIVNDIFTSNTYLLFDGEYDYCWLVDIGDFGKVSDVLPPYFEIKGVFLTHAHFDHIYGANKLLKSFPQCKVYTSDSGKEALYDDKKNFSKYHETSFVYKGNNVEILSEGSVVEIYPHKYMTTYYTPGHSPSCLCYMVDDLFFTGDSYIPGIKVVTKLPLGDRKEAAKSIERILEISKGKKIYPGHGEIFYK